MSGEATATYALLLLNMWESKTKYSVPDDDRLIANMLRIGKERWLQLKNEIMWEGDPCLIQKKRPSGLAAAEVGAGQAA